MKREFSAGGIVFKNNQVLVVKNASLADPNKSYWGFPKGHIEKSEKSEHAATREVLEETGITVEIKEKLGESRYVYTRNGERIFKVVAFFLMEYQSGQLEPQVSEISEAKWTEPEEALGALSFSNDKTFLKKALKIRGQLVNKS